MGQSAALVFESPTGVAISQSRVIVADAGNRRLRSIPLPELRGPIGSHLEELGEHGKTYRIAFVSNSFGFFHSEWNDSIANGIENMLNAHARSIGLNRPVKVAPVRLDGAGLSDTFSYVNELLGEGEVDMVVLMVNQYMPIFEMLKTRSGPSPLVLPEYWAELRTLLQGTSGHLRSNHVSFLVATLPAHNALSPLTYVDGRVRKFGPGFDFDAMETNDLSLEDAVRASGVPFISLFPAFTQMEQSAHADPLYDTLDGHLAPAGNALVARVLGSALEERKPWLVTAAAATP